MNIKRRYIIIAFLLLGGILTAAWFLRPQGTLELTAAPDEMTMLVNGEKRTVKHGQHLTLTPGDYTAEFKRDGFSTEQLSFKISNKQVVAITVALTPQTEAAKQLFNNNAEFVKIAATYKKQKQARFLQLLPLSSTSFSLHDCSSIRVPRSQAPAAICIMTNQTNGEAHARRYISQQGYSLDGLDVMVGNNNLAIIKQTTAYKIETSIIATSQHAELYVTPLNTPPVPSSTPHNDQLETIKRDALTFLTDAGYNLSKVTVYYSNTYLSRYNPDIHTDHREE
jgi:hypothetical protein